MFRSIDHLSFLSSRVVCLHKKKNRQHSCLSRKPLCSERETIFLFVRSQTTLAGGSLLTQQLILASHNEPPRNAASCFLGLEAYLRPVFYSFKS